jgi:branched-chain amino acid transport system permease protein
MEILLYAMIVVVVGGPGSVSGTFVAALLIGIVDSLGKAFFPDMAMFTIYIVFVFMLLVKPTGLMGKKAI